MRQPLLALTATAALGLALFAYPSGDTGTNGAHMLLVPAAQASEIDTAPAAITTDAERDWPWSGLLTLGVAVLLAGASARHPAGVSANP